MGEGKKGKRGDKGEGRGDKGEGERGRGDEDIFGHL